jgi:hypothetical protein
MADAVTVALGIFSAGNETRFTCNLGQELAYRVPGNPHRLDLSAVSMMCPKDAARGRDLRSAMIHHERVR